MARKTMGVLAGAYPRSNDQRAFLTHRAEVTNGWPVPLCSRVKRGSLTDDTTQHTDERPTCPACARIYDKEQG
jgi:hypothetical protein